MPASDRIRERRHAIGLSLDDLVERLRHAWPSVNKGTLSKIENGQRKLLADELPMFAVALECEPSDLVDPAQP